MSGSDCALILSEVGDRWVGDSSRGDMGQGSSGMAYSITGIRTGEGGTGARPGSGSPGTGIGVFGGDKGRLWLGTPLSSSSSES